MDRNAILPMLSYQGWHVRAAYIGCIGIHAHGRQVMSLLCKSESERIQGLLEAYFKTKNSREQDKEPWFGLRVGEKNLPLVITLSSLGKPGDANR